VKYRSRREIENHRATGTERLARLADFLDTVEDGRLTFSRWYGDGKGCAVALAAAEEPWFQAQGLALLHVDAPRDCHPVYDGATEWRALARFFELDVSALRRLFDRTGYGGNICPRPSEVAGKIRARLAAAKAEAA
jgi:hypothetical protein